MTRLDGDGKAAGLTRRDFAHAAVKAGVAAGLAAWVAPQVSSYALAQTTGRSPPSAGSRKGDDPAATGQGSDPAGTGQGGDPTGPAIQPGEGDPHQGDRRRRTTAPAAEGVVSDPRFTG